MILIDHLMAFLTKVRSSSLMGNAMWAIVVHLFSRGSLTLFTILMARTLTGLEFAAYNFFHLTVVAFSSYAALGVGILISRYFAELNGGDGGQWAAIKMALLISIFAAFVLVLILIFLPQDTIGLPGMVSKSILIAALLLTLISILTSSAIMGLEQFKAAAVIAIIAAVIMLVGGIFSYVLKSLPVALAAYVIALAARNLGELFVISRKVGLSALWNVRLVQSIKTWRAVTGFISPMALASVLSATVPWISGRLILQGHTDTEFNVYVIGFQWYAIALFVPAMLLRVIFPRMVRASSSGKDTANSKNLLRTSILLIVPIAVGIASLVAIMSPLILSFYGQIFSSYYHVLIVFMLAAAIGSSVNALGNMIVINDGQWIWLVFNVITVTITLITLVLLMPLGAVAAPIALSIGSGILVILSGSFAIRKGIL